MRKLSFIICLILTGSTHVSTQDYFCDTQDCVDNFRQLYPDTEEFPWVITISGPDITDLSAFDKLKIIWGLSVSGTTLPNLDGLSKLEEIHTLVINDNRDMMSLSGLGSLNHATNISISGNIQMESLNALSGLKKVESLSLTGNGLKDLVGLGQIDTIIHNLEISHHDALKDITMTNLKRVRNLNLTYNPGLLDISGFPNLESVENISIHNNADLISISGFERLADATKWISIHDNLSLELVSGFNNIESLMAPGSTIQILNCMALKTISGFRSIKILGGDLILDQLASLLEIDGFQMLTHVEGSLRISSCKLKNLDAMSNLRSVGEDFTISGNPEMTELYGENMVSLMEEVGRVFFVTGNDKLASIRNMPYFQSAGRLLISYNPQLVDIEGLSNLSNIAETFDVLDNPSLSQCAIESICRLLEEPGKVRIVANAAGCNSASEVATQCTNSINDSYREPLRIFPNPAVQHLYITTPTNSVPFSAFRIYTLNGRLVTTGYAGRDGLLDISTLEPGIYTIRKDAGMSGAVTSFIKL